MSDIECSAVVSAHGENSALQEWPLQASSHAAPWLVAYTQPRHEKRVAEHLERKCIEQFLPLYESVRQWKGRRARVLMPLFPSYVFVRLPAESRVRVLELPGVVRLVGFADGPATLPDSEVETLRRGACARLEPYPYLTAGRKVRVRNGPLAGANGFLVRRKGGFRVVLSLALIERSVAAEVDLVDIEPLN